MTQRLQHKWYRLSSATLALNSKSAFINDRSESRLSE